MAGRGTGVDPGLDLTEPSEWEIQDDRPLRPRTEQRLAPSLTECLHRSRGLMTAPSPHPPGLRGEYWTPWAHSRLTCYAASRGLCLIS